MNLNLKMTCCKDRKIRMAQYSRYYSIPYCPGASQASVQWFSLKFSSKDNRNYVDDKGEVGKLRTARGKKTSQILAPKCCWPRANL